MISEREMAKKIIAYVHDYARQYGQAPTLQEIAGRFETTTAVVGKINVKLHGVQHNSRKTTWPHGRFRPTITAAT